MDIFLIASQVNRLIFGAKTDDSFSDRLNHRYTVGILVLFSIILTTRQFSSETISCWCPAHFTGSFEKYVEKICWVTNTYHQDRDENIPKDPSLKKKGEIKYYQWVAFVILFQAFFFYIPRIVWRTFSLRAGLNITDLVEAADNYKSSNNVQGARGYMNYLIKNIDQFVDDSRRYENNRKKSKLTKITSIIIPCLGRFLGNYIVILYMLVKILYIINTFLQIWLVSVFLGKNFVYFGLEFFWTLITKQEWTVINSNYFPKTSLCDFTIREYGNPNKSHTYTVQCALPINLFNQQVFTVIWLWYFLLLIVNIYGSIQWLQKLVPRNAKKWIYKRVSYINQGVRTNGKRMDHFLDRYLEPDGIFMIRIIANNTSDYVASDIISGLWCQHAEKYDALFPDFPHDDQNSGEKCPFFDHSPRKSVLVYHKKNQYLQENETET